MSRVDRAEPDWDGVVRTAHFLLGDLKRILETDFDITNYNVIDIGMRAGTIIEQALNEIHHRVNGVE